MENEISILIVEDEEIWIQQLKHMLDEFGFTVTKTVSTVEDALSTLSSCEYDLVLLDIHLNGKNSGIELGKIISKLYNKPFIFTTASHYHEIKEATDTRPSAYLPKPINPASLFVAIQNAINNSSNNQRALKEDAANFTSFFVKQGARFKKIDWEDVVFLSAGKNYTSVFNAQNLQKQFLQVNRSEAVQLSFILEVSNDELKTAFKSFTISETYSKEMRAKLNVIS
jgi:CheY-like chemotaxis protein